MYWKVIVFLKCVFKSRMDFSLNLVPLYTTVSKNTVSVSAKISHSMSSALKKPFHVSFMFEILGSQPRGTIVSTPIQAYRPSTFKDSCCTVMYSMSEHCLFILPSSFSCR